MKKLFAVLVVALLLSGCIGSSRPGGNWSTKINSYSITNELESDYYYYYPDAGYEWLVFDVSVTNNKQTEESLSLIFVGEGFDFVSAGGNRYGMSSWIIPPYGALPENYKPQQTRTGKVFFEVPVGTQIEKGKLIFKSLENKKDTIFDLEKVPAR